MATKPANPPTLTWAGNEPIVIDGVTPSSLGAPAMTEYHGILYALFCTSNKEQPSIWQLAYDGDSWTGNTGVNWSGSTDGPQSLCNPAVATMNGVLYMAYYDQGSSSDDSASINIASLTWTKGTTGALPSDSWVSLSNDNTAPIGSTNGLSMVVYPYNGTPSLWIFYNNKDYVCVAIAQPLASGAAVNWVVEWQINDWPNTTITPQLHGGPGAAVLSYTNPVTKATQSAPYVVFQGTDIDNIYSYVYYDATTDTFVGNEHIDVFWGPAYTVVKSETNPCLVPLVPATLGAMLYKGNTGTSVDLSIYGNGVWYANLPIQLISKHTGTTEINPTTSIGVGAAMFGLTTLMMVYPSADSQDNVYLYWASLTIGA